MKVFTVTFSKLQMQKKKYIYKKSCWPPYFWTLLLIILLYKNGCQQVNECNLNLEVSDNNALCTYSLKAQHHMHDSWGH